MQAFGHLDFAHNNAGVELQATVVDTEEADWERVLAVNLKGVWLGMKHQIPAMLEHGGGSIVNTASLAGLMAVPTLAAYIASKHGVVGLTRAAAVEVANDGIRVNCVCPAAIRTAMMDVLPEERQLELLAPQAMKRFGEPREVAESVVWLCSDRSSFVTGRRCRSTRARWRSRRTTPQALRCRPQADLAQHRRRRRSLPAARGEDPVAVVGAQHDPRRAVGRRGQRGLAQRPRAEPLRRSTRRWTSAWRTPRSSSGADDRGLGDVLDA